MNSSKRILIADDDEALVDAISRRCEQLSLEVYRAHDAVTALESIDRLEPNLVVLDVNMPGGNGMSLCQAMAQDDCLREIPVIIMTGRQDEEVIRSCHDLLAYYVLKSPDVWNRLQPLIRDLLPERPTAAADAMGLVAQPASVPKEDRFTEAVFATACLAIPSDHSDVPSLRAHVLCIEDDRDFSAALKRRLEEWGLSVQQAFSGMEGYRRAFATSPVQAIVIDYEMPDGNGDYVLRRLGENPLTREIPAIVLTGHRDKPLERKMLGLGVTRVLIKPPDWDLLRSELRQVLS